MYGTPKTSPCASYTDKLGNQHSEGTDIANSFNRYFISIPHETIYNGNCRENDSDFLDLVPISEHTMYINPTSPDEIHRIIFNLNNNSNLSDIPLKFIKLAVYEYSLILFNIINKVIETGTYPDLLKIAEVHPIPKKKPSSLIINNRPISILHVFDKIIEKILHDRLMSFFEKYDLLSSSQFGFRKGMGTDTAILRLLDFLYPSFHNCSYSIALFADLTKAFDCTVHKRLLRKLWRYVITH